MLLKMIQRRSGPPWSLSTYNSAMEVISIRKKQDESLTSLISRIEDSVQDPAASSEGCLQPLYHQVPG